MGTSATHVHSRSDGTASAVGRGVVVGYDASPSAEQALTWAARVSALREESLTVLCTEQLSVLVAPGPGMMWELREAARQTAEHGVAGLRHEGAFASLADVRVQAPTGSPAAALIDASREADLVVVGHRGRGLVTNALLGSVAFSVAARAHCPVVVVRGEADRFPGPDLPVVVGVDGTPGSQEALRVAVEIARRTEAPLHVLSAWTAPEPVAAEYLTTTAVTDAGDLGDTEHDQARTTARSAHEDALAMTPDLIVLSAVIESDPAAALVESSARAGLVVVGARGRGAVSGLLLGSVSHETIHGAHCPVAVVRAPGTEPEMSQR